MTVKIFSWSNVFSVGELLLKNGKSFSFFWKIYKVALKCVLYIGVKIEGGHICFLIYTRWRYLDTVDHSFWMFVLVLVYKLFYKVLWCNEYAMGCVNFEIESLSFCNHRIIKRTWLEPDFFDFFYCYLIQKSKTDLRISHKDY